MVGRWCRKESPIVNCEGIKRCFLETKLGLVVGGKRGKKMGKGEKNSDPMRNNNNNNKKEKKEKRFSEVFGMSSALKCRGFW